MSPASRTYVLDANAIMDFVEAGPGSGKVAQLLKDAAQPQTTVMISAVNWGEVFYSLWQRNGEAVARNVTSRLAKLPFQIIAVDVPQALKAGEIKVRHKIPYVDCLAAALAALSDATLVTSDRDFEKLGRHFPILWIHRP